VFVLVSRDPLTNEQRKGERGYSIKLPRFERAIFTAIFVLLLGVIHGCSIKQNCQARRVNRSTDGDMHC
jgi:hypothetical protein